MAGGYSLPFFVYGVAYICIAPLIYLIPKDEELSQTQNQNMTEPNTNTVPHGLFEIQTDDEDNTTPPKVQAVNRVSDLSDPVDLASLQTTASMLSLLSQKRVLKLLFFAMFDMTILNFSPVILTKRLKQLGVD